MFATSFSRGIGLAGLLFIAAVVALSGQAPAATLPPAGLQELLNEVRELRGELNQAAAVSIRMQLLVARMTLQEQRLTTLDYQVADVHAQLETATRARSETQAKARELEDTVARGTLTAEEVRQSAYELKLLSGTLSDQSTREQQLRAHENDLLAAVAAERSRWLDFNARLDELERSLPTVTSTRGRE